MHIVYRVSARISRGLRVSGWPSASRPDKAREGKARRAVNSYDNLSVDCGIWPIVARR